MLPTIIPRDAGPSAQWVSELTFKFCNLCITEIQKGNRPTTHFNKEGWNHIIKKFSEGTGRQYDRTQLKNKWDQLKKDWKLWHDLKHGATGLGWDPNRRTIMASDERWNEKLQVFPMAKKFRSNGISPELEVKLDMMFANIVATGEFAWTPNSGVLPPDMVEGIGDSDDTTDEVIPTQKLSEAEPLVGTKRGSISDKKKENKKTKKNAAQRFSGKIDQLIEQTLNLSATASVNSRGQNSKEDIATALAIVDSIVKFEDEALYGFAVDLVQSREKRNVFLGIEISKRLWFLQREFNKANNAEFY